MLKQASKIRKKVFIRLFPLLMKVSGQVPCSLHSKNFNWHYMYSNAASIFILLQLSTGNITLCENMLEASEMTEKVPFAAYFCSWWSSMFVSLMTNAPKCTSRWCLSTRQFFRAGEKTFTQNTIEYGLSENCSFDFKFNVPVGFWWYWN